MTTTNSNFKVKNALDVEGSSASSIAGNLLIGTTTDDATHKLQVAGSAIINNIGAVRGGNGISLLVGSDTTSTSTVTDATQKSARVAVPHYTLAEEPVAAIFVTNASSSNDIQVGGGSSLTNAATSIKLVTAANNTTTTGTVRLQINAAGRTLVGPTVPTDDGFNALQVNGSVGITTGLNIGGSAPCIANKTVGDRLLLTAATNASVTGGAAIALRESTTATNPYGMEFFTNGSEAARITSNKNILIGTTTDNGTDKLQVSGSVSATSFSGSGASLTSLNATNISSGTLAAARLPAFGSGDVSFASSGGAGTIASGVVSNAKLATMAANSIKGNNTGSVAAPVDLTTAQVKTLLAISNTDVSGLGSLATASSVNLSTQATGVLQAAQHPALTGDVTNTVSTVATTISNNVVSNAKLADVPTSTFKGRVTAGTGDPEDLTVTQAKTLLAYTASDVSALPLAGGTLTGNLKVGSVLIGNTNEINSAGASALALNYRNSDQTTTSFVDTDIYNGKNSLIFRAKGSSSNLLVGTTTDSGDRLNVSGTINCTGFGTNVPAFSSSAKGLVPASGGGTTNFLRADGSWMPPPTTGVQTGSFTISSGSGNFSSILTTTAYYTVINRTVFLSIPAGMSGTSTSVLFDLTGLPAAIQTPSARVSGFTTINGTTFSQGYGEVQNSAILLGRWSTTTSAFATPTYINEGMPFIASGTKGIPAGTTMIYSI